MRKLTDRSRLPHTAVMLSLGDQRTIMFDSRAALISKMSGYPTSMHALQRLQRTINLDSYRGLLESLLQLHHLATITADVIESMDSTNFNKYQINRQEIDMYVANIVSARVDYSPTSDEIDLIAHLITTSEANPNSWLLVASDKADNLHLKFYKLYKEVLMSENPEAIAAFDSGTGDVLEFSKVPYYAGLVTAPNEGEGAGPNKASETHLRHIAAIYRFAATRVIDHVYQLMMDRDTWYAFLAPRKSADAASNLERARTLRVFALYLQSLLTYHQFFMLESFLFSYDKIQQWIIAFPSLETESLNKIEGTIRRHDYLGAQADVKALFDSFESSTKQDLDMLVFPIEYTSTFGFTKKLRSIEEEIRKITVPATIEQLEDLDKPIYLPLIAGTSAGKFDIAYDLAILLVRDKVVKSYLNAALQSLIPSLTKGSSKASMSGLAALNIKCSLPFEIPLASAYEIEAGAAKGIRGGVLMLDSAAPDYSYAYHEVIRKQMKFKIIPDHSVATLYPDMNLGFVVDEDKAEQLRRISEVGWRSYMPSFMHASDREWKEAEFTVSVSAIKAFLESIMLVHYEIAIRQLAVDDMTKLLATYLSSCALLYKYTNKGLADERDLETIYDTYKPAVDNGFLKLVRGYGRPYGTRYDALEKVAGVPTDKDILMPLGKGLFIRFLPEIPLPTDTLVFDFESFIGGQPFSYFASNSGKKKVMGWVPAEGLQHMALFPTHSKTQVPIGHFSSKYAYSNVQLYLNMNAFYKPAAPKPAREKVSLPVVTEAWPLERLQMWIEYRKFGKYATPLDAPAPTDDTELLTKALEEIEKNAKQDTKVMLDQADAAKDAAGKVATNAEQAVADVTKRRSLDDSDEPTKPVI